MNHPFRDWKDKDAEAAGIGCVLGWVAGLVVPLLLTLLFNGPLAMFGFSRSSIRTFLFLVGFVGCLVLIGRLGAFNFQRDGNKGGAVDAIGGFLCSALCLFTLLTWFFGT